MKRYTTTINGIETTLLLSDADAKERGLKPDDDNTKAKEPTPPAKKAAKAPANKARTAANKSGNAGS